MSPPESRALVSPDLSFPQPSLANGLHFGRLYEKKMIRAGARQGVERFRTQARIALTSDIRHGLIPRRSNRPCCPARAFPPVEECEVQFPILRFCFRLRSPGKSVIQHDCFHSPINAAQRGSPPASTRGIPASAFPNRQTVSPRPRHEPD
jgi:hypothetical protein